jgi:hypothetical protein
MVHHMESEFARHAVKAYTETKPLAMHTGSRTDRCLSKA